MFAPAIPFRYFTSRILKEYYENILEVENIENDTQTRINKCTSCAHNLQTGSYQVL